MASVSYQKQPKLFARGMKEYGWRWFLILQAARDLEIISAEAFRRAYVAAIWRAWGGPK